MPMLRTNAFLVVLLLALTACGGGPVEPVSKSAGSGGTTPPGGGGGPITPPPIPPVVVDTTPPSTPGNVVGTPAGSTGATLSWSASTDNVAVANYIIKRNGTQVGTSITLSYADVTLSPATTYTYTVTARDGANNTSPESAVVSVTTDAAGPPPSPPPPPLAGTALGNLAASMAAGTWAQLVVSNQNSILGVGNVSGTMIHFSNSMPWNPFSKVIEIIGSDHGYGRTRHVRYDVATNQFILISDDAGI